MTLTSSGTSSGPARPGPRGARQAVPAHRPDIQGLRAVAVLTVIAAHAHVPGLAGGFVGVDVFFVISGFLISQLLFREVERDGRLSLPGFYARRARRILPAATLVTIATLLASAAWLSAVDLLEVVRDALWSTFFLANVHFAAVGTDYFAQEDPPSPLQHYWSLSVEEQFYLVWPALLLLLVLGVRAARRRRGATGPALPRVAVLWLLVAVTALSFGWSLVHTADDPLVAYFSTTARAWELGLGALTALVADGLGRRLRRAARGALGLAGLAMIVVACLTYTSDTAFPGAAAALPVLGAALVLVAGAGHQNQRGPAAAAALSARLLGVAPMRVVGDWSYSLYLWHWPVLIIAERHHGGDLGPLRTTACLVVVFGLAALTYRFVETPFRSPLRFPVWRALVLYPVAVALVAVTAGGGHAYSRYTSGELGDHPAITLSNFANDPSAYQLAQDPTVALVQASVIAARDGHPVPSHLRPDVLDLRNDLPDVGKCDYEHDSRDVCPMGDTTASRSIVVFGNSHGRMWIPAFDAIGKKLGYTTYYFVKPNCSASLVTVGELVPGSPAWGACTDFRDWALDQIATLHPSLVVVSSSGPNPVLYDASGDRIAAADEPAATSAGYATLFQRLAPIADHTVLLRDVPKSTQEPDTCLTASGHDLGDCMFRPLGASVQDADLSVAAARQADVDVVDPTRWLCWQDECPVVIGDMLPYRDRGHLSTVYAAYLAPELVRALGLTQP